MSCVSPFSNSFTPFARFRAILNYSRDKVKRFPRAVWISPRQSTSSPSIARYTVYRGSRARCPEFITRIIKACSIIVAVAARSSRHRGLIIIEQLTTVDCHYRRGRRARALARASSDPSTWNNFALHQRSCTVRVYKGEEGGGRASGVHVYVWVYT
jgi:hypothetical protein